MSDIRLSEKMLDYTEECNISTILMIGISKNVVKLELITKRMKYKDTSRRIIDIEILQDVNRPTESGQKTRFWE